jgi:thiol-disulfide isomerase/thioredoxin
MQPFKTLAYNLMIPIGLVSLIVAQFNGKLPMLNASNLNAADAQGQFTPAPNFVAGGQWFNSKPRTIESLRGKVTIVNIWVYSCINCHNSLPTLQSWYRTYKNQGLEIIGVHTPEFESDKPAANVIASLKETGVTWPVMQDNNYATWNAYHNSYWPAFYLLDRQGNIRATHVGEISSRSPDAIPGLEKTIQDLLAESPTTTQVTPTLSEALSPRDR